MKDTAQKSEPCAHAGKGPPCREATLVSVYGYPLWLCKFHEHTLDTELRHSPALRVSYLRLGRQARRN